MPEHNSFDSSDLIYNNNIDQTMTDRVIEEENTTLIMIFVMKITHTGDLCTRNTANSCDVTVDIFI